MCPWSTAEQPPKPSATLTCWSTQNHSRGPAGQRLFFKCSIHLPAPATYILAALSGMVPKHLTGLQRHPAVVSFRAELDMLQNISFNFKPVTPPTRPLSFQNLFTANASLSRQSQCTQAFLLQKPAMLKLSISFYHFLFQFSLCSLEHRHIQLSTISSSDHLVSHLPWAAYQEQSLPFPAQVSLATLKERSGK